MSRVGNYQWTKGRKTARFMLSCLNNPDLSYANDIVLLEIRKLVKL